MFAIVERRDGTLYVRQKDGRLVALDADRWTLVAGVPVYEDLDDEDLGFSLDSALAECPESEVWLAEAVEELGLATRLRLVRPLPPKAQRHAAKLAAAASEAIANDIARDYRAWRP